MERPARRKARVMTRIKTFTIAPVLLALVAVFVVSAGSATVASAESRHERFSSIAYTCAVGPLENVEQTETSIRFDSTRTLQWVSDSELASGETTQAQSVYIDFDRGSGTNRAHGILQTREGDWRYWLRLKLNLSDNTGQGFGLAVGKGDLRGRVMLFKVELASVSAQDNPCSDRADGMLVTGRILGRG